jgi:Clr5 domain
MASMFRQAPYQGQLRAHSTAVNEIYDLVPSEIWTRFKPEISELYCSPSMKTLEDVREYMRTHHLFEASYV